MFKETLDKHSNNLSIVDKTVLVKEFRKFLPTESLILDQARLSAYECDGLTAHKQLPLIVVLPENNEQVRRCILTCRNYGVPIVPRGAGTGLSGGATPHPQGVVLGLSKLNKIISIDADNLTARLQCGVRNAAISEAVAKYNLFYAPDPSSQIACSIGGNVAENAGGLHCIKYGLTVHNVLGLQIVTPEGEIVEIGGERLDSPGFDLLALYCGSEGLLGIVTEVTVKLTPKPEQVELIMAGFNRIEDAADAVSHIIAQGIIPSGLEIMDRYAIKATNDYCQAGYPDDADAILLCELDGSEIVIQEFVGQVKSILKSSDASSVVIAKNQQQRSKMWLGRKSAFPAAGKISPDYYCMDGTIPRSKLSYVLNEMKKLSLQYSLEVINVFHAGDGNLHPLILYDASNPKELNKAEKMGNDILKLCVDVGGTVTGEHGVGVEKLDSMCHQFNDNELAQFHRLKAALDETGILNPEKAIPTLSRCSEVGGMHVHQGQLPFPEIERF